MQYNVIRAFSLRGKTSYTHTLSFIYSSIISAHCRIYSSVCNIIACCVYRNYCPLWYNSHHREVCVCVYCSPLLSHFLFFFFCEKLFFAWHTRFRETSVSRVRNSHLRCVWCTQVHYYTLDSFIAPAILAPSRKR